MAGGTRLHLPAAKWLGAAARALLFGVAVLILEQAVHGALGWAAPADPRALLAVYTGGTLLAAVLVGVVFLRLFHQRPAGALGIALSPQVPRELGVGLLAGVLPQLLIALLLAFTGALTFLPTAGSAVGWLGNVGYALVVLTVAAAAEEAVYRGYGFQALVQGFGRWPTLLVTSGLFALAHARNPAVTPVALGNIFLAGVVLGLAYLRTLSLWLVTALHVGWNWSMASLLDLPVSGLGLFDTPVYEPVSSAPAWVGGGAFGPEGGLLGTAGLLLALGLAWRWPGMRPSQAQLAARPLAVSDEERVHE